jgi:hypothetical protein
LIDIHAGDAKILGVSLVSRERSITQGMGKFPVTGRLKIGKTEAVWAFVCLAQME